MLLAQNWKIIRSASRYPEDNDKYDELAKTFHRIVRTGLNRRIRIRKSVGTSLMAAERVGVQLPRARCSDFHQKTDDLAREAVNCNAMLDGGQVYQPIKRLHYFSHRKALGDAVANDL